VTGEEKDVTSGRSARSPAPDRKPRRRPRHEPSTFLDFIDGVVGDDQKTKNLRSLVYALAAAIAVILGIVGLVLVLANIQITLGYTVVSAATAAGGILTGVAVRHRRRKKRLAGRSADPAH
jgi:hypothetical protein